MQPNPPTIDRLRSSDERSSEAAWRIAYPLFWEVGMRVARIRLAGECYEQDREDIVSTAVQQFVLGLIGGKSDSFNQLSSWDDCLAMMRHIVRLRVTDYHRSHARNRIDTVEELPELASNTCSEQNFTLPELLHEVDALEPNPPVPQVFRDRFLEGRSTDEIAKARNLNRNTLVSYYAKGLRTLRERLLPQEFLP